MIVHADSTILIAVFDKQLDGLPVFLRVLDGVLETLTAIRRAIDGDDLCPGGKAVLERESVPHHVGEPAFAAGDHPERVSQISNSPAGLGVLEIVRRRLGIDELVAASA